MTKFLGFLCPICLGAILFEVDLVPGDDSPVRVNGIPIQGQRFSLEGPCLELPDHKTEEAQNQIRGRAIEMWEQWNRPSERR